MEPILERAVGSFGGHFIRWLSPEEFAAGIEHADAERLRRRGYMIDPFTVTGRFGRRVVYRIVADPIPGADEVVMATDSDDNPFDVTELVEDELIPWSLDDQAKAAKFTNSSRPSVIDASLDATNFWLQARDPFRVSVNG